MSTTTLAPATSTAWLSLLRDLHAAGWRHRIVPAPPGQVDGPDWVEHEWARGDERINAYADLDSGRFVSYLNYCPTLDAGDPDTADIHVGIAAARGPVWLRKAMVLSGILTKAAPRVWAMPEIPEDVTRVVDRYGLEWYPRGTLWTYDGYLSADPPSRLLAGRGPVTEVVDDHA